jgi:hypothetical protein
MSHTHHHRHARVSVGRLKVAIVCVLVLAADGWIFKRAARGPEIKAMEVAALIGIPWVLAGAWGLCTRKGWGRALMLGVIYIGSFAGVVTWLAAMTGDPGPLRDRATPLIAGTGVYAVCGLLLSKSRDVRRLTSRALE